MNIIELYVELGDKLNYMSSELNYNLRMELDCNVREKIFIDLFVDMSREINIEFTGELYAELL